jgi:hypothetical protein
MEPFNAEMKVLKKQMEVYEKQMQSFYQAKMKANNNSIKKCRLHQERHFFISVK